MSMNRTIELRRILAAIARASLVLAIAMTAGGCKEKAAASDDTPGCAKDTDCKGDRVCVGGKCQPQPPAAVTQTATPTPIASAPALSAPASSSPTALALAKATITVPPNKQGVAQRAIVKDKAGAAGKEIARIDNSTPVGVIRKAEGGLWVNIRWPYPDGTQEGWVHVNLLRE